MAQQICPICGLPKDLCVCQEIVKEEQRIKIRTEKRKWGRDVTIIEGIDSKDVDLAKLATKLKSALACGGTAKDGRIELQGDHRYRAKELLVEWGYSEENIDVS
ncbi:MAG: stress response translation initiation inhibitor YciH [Candidatus Freyarchaeota archaeon]|nr:stress response translation initiation inhibitor YciH [Candidatus Freyarchaeota archaeon]MDO8090750.1 stress response translation initiation inhibitor YciH [Candidatus Sigynarchaeota archaeon]